MKGSQLRPHIIGYRRNGCPIWAGQGGAPTGLEQIEQRLNEIKDELAAIAKLPEPDDPEEAQRAQTLEDRASLTDELLDEFDKLDAEAKPIREREARRGRVLQ